VWIVVANPPFAFERSLVITSAALTLPQYHRLRKERHIVTPTSIDAAANSSFRQSTTHAKAELVKLELPLAVAAMLYALSVAPPSMPS
jgi:hypothetical protein